VPTVSDRIGRKPALIMSFLVSACAPLVVAYLDGALAMLSGAIFLAWLGMGAMPVMLATVPAESVHGSYSNRAIGMVIGISEVIGGCLSPVVCGISADVFGPRAPFAIGAVTAVLAAVLACFLTETAPNRRVSKVGKAAKVAA